MESLQTMLSDPESLAPTLALDLGLTPDQARLPALLMHSPEQKIVHVITSEGCIFAARSLLAVSFGLTKRRCSDFPDVQQRWEEGHITRPWLSQKDLGGKELLPASDSVAGVRTPGCWLLLHAAERKTDMSYRPPALQPGFCRCRALL